MKDLQGKTALVTGASRNLGRAMAERLAQAGAIVAVNYAQDANAAKDTVATIKAAGGQAFVLHAQLGKPGADEAVLAGLDEGLSKLAGRSSLDILVNNVGGGTYGTISTSTPAQYDEIFQNNLKTPFFLTQALLPRLVDGGRVINISSAAARLAGTDFITYSMSKAALNMFTSVLAKELGPRRITVNAVLPGFNTTSSNDDVMGDPAVKKMIEEATAFGRFGEPADIAEVVYFLASPASAWVTGQFIEASGGFRM